MRTVATVFMFVVLAQAPAHADQDVVRVGLPFSPTYSEMIDGECVGVFCDWTYKVFRDALDLQIEIVEHPWQRVQRQVEKGEIDVMYAMPSDARLKYGIASDRPIFITELRIYTYAGHPRLEEIRAIKTIQDIKDAGLVSITNEGNGWHISKVEKLGIKTVRVKDDKHILKLLTARRGDITIDATPSMRRIIQDAGLDGDVVETDVILDQVKQHIIISKKSRFARLMPDIDILIEDAGKP